MRDTGGNMGIEIRGEHLLLESAQGLTVSVASPRFCLDGAGWVGGDAPVSVSGDADSGELVEISYTPMSIGDGLLEVRGFVQWSAEERVLRKWASYRLQGISERVLVSEIILDEMDAEGWDCSHFGPIPQSYPAFRRGFFAGIEYPVAFTRLENDRIVLAHKPGIWLEPDVWHETRKAVYGVTEVGHERDGFKSYIAKNRPTPTGMHIDYNSWWTSPVPYSEESILEIMQQFSENLYKPYHISLDSFCIDMGWSDPQSPWEIDKKLFPNGFGGIKRGAEEMGSHLGLWISPSAFYSPHALDTEWAKEHGYETLPRPGADDLLCCLGGKKYQSMFQERLLEMVGKWDVRQFKFDASCLICPETDHGHEPGELSAEAIADGLISAFDAIHDLQPDAWMEATCFTINPSPWWLFHVNSVLGAYGDDAPHGRVPCPIYRESYTTARDYFNLQGAERITVPIVAQDVLGILHQTEDPFVNDALTSIMRGHMFLPLYINPRDMNPARWKMLAELLTWARANSDILQETLPLLPASWQNGKTPMFTNDGVMPREAYGYAHGNGERSLILLRNPWIAETTYSLTLDDSCGLSPGSTGLSVVSLYPEVRLYGNDLSSGDTLDIQLAPYETLVLSIASDQPAEDVPIMATEDGVKVSVSKRKVDFADDSSAIQVDVVADVEVFAPQAGLLFLVEDVEPVTDPTVEILIDGVQIATALSGTNGAWTASSIPATEHWVFLGVPLPMGKHAVDIKMSVTGKSPTVSAWVWATKPGSGRPIEYPNALPSPELVSVGALALLKPLCTKRN